MKQRAIFLTVLLSGLLHWSYAAAQSALLELVRIPLQNATATYSQSESGDFSPSWAIDGSNDSFNGWAIWPQITNQIAVFETAADAGSGEDTLVFKLYFSHYSPPPSSGHMLGRFRLSATGSSRQTFADGLRTDGNVTADWTVLQPLAASSEAGATLTVLNDQSVLASGSFSTYVDVYTVTVRNPLPKITGFRLEALQHPTLPHDGPGREPLNGNFVLSEFEVSVQHPILMSEGLVAHYELDGDGADSSGNQLNAQVSGATPATNRFGLPDAALHFDGSDDLVNAGNPAAFNFASNFTIHAWVKPDREQFSKYILGKYFGREIGMPNSYGLGTADFQGSAYAFVSGPSWGYHEIRPGTSLDLAWTALAIVYDQQSGLKLYQNGTLVGSVYAPAIGTFTNTAPFTIGGLSDGQFFAGTIDDVRVYNRALSADAVRVLYAASFPPNILRQPESLAIVQGTEAVFRVEIASESPVTYQWFFNGGAIPGETNMSLVLPSARFSQAGTYWASISNRDGVTTSSAATLQVLSALESGTVDFRNRSAIVDAPIIDPYGSPLSGTNFLVQLYAGQSAAGPRPVGAAIPFGTGTNSGYFSGGLRQIVGIPSGAHIQVEVRAWETAAGPSYEEAVANGGARGISDPLVVSLGGGEAPPAELSGLESFTLLGKPRIDRQLSSSTNSPGSSVTLMADVSGTPPLSIEWFRNTNTITVSKNPSLTLTNLQPIDSGTYYFIVSNPYGAATSAPATLIVREIDREAPVITFSSPTNRTTDSATVTLAGTILDNVAVTRAEWFKNDVPQGSLALSNGVFNVRLALVRGENVIVIRAYDAEQNTATANLAITFAAAREFYLAEVPSAKDGTEITIPVLLRSAGEVGGASITLSYPREFLTLLGFQWTLSSQGIVQVNTNLVGQIRASFALSGTTLPAGVSTLATATFRVRSIPADTNAQLDLALQGVFGSDGRPITSLTDVRGRRIQLLRRAFIGDNNGNNQLDVGDASILMRLLSLLDPIRSWDVTLNDLNQNAQLDAGDAIRILRAVVGLDSQPGPIGGLTAQSAGAGVNALSLTADKLRAVVNEKVTVKVRLDPASMPVAGASFVLAWPTNALRLDDSTSVIVRTLPGNSLSLWNVEPGQSFPLQSGKLRFAASSETLWSTGPIDLLELRFTVQAGATGFSAPIDLQAVNLSDGWNVSGASNSSLALAIGENVKATFSGLARQPDGTLKLNAAGEPGANYVVETSADLATWSPVAPALNENGTITFSETQVQEHHRFYRLKRAE